MTVRTLTLGTAAIAAALFCALPASAQPYSHNSTPAERAQTDALNSGAMDRAHGDANSDAMARDNYNANRANYDRNAHDNAMQRAAYERDMARYDRRWGGHNRSNGTISVSFGDIAFGYSDGYWDNGHRWHNWRNDAEAREYRRHQGNNYHGWRHDRDHDNGWTRR